MTPEESEQSVFKALPCDYESAWSRHRCVKKHR
ncbi:hypothetical protein GGE65_003288 [Skermanella aerolata]